MRQFICLLFFSIIMKERKKRSVKISLTAFCIFILSIFTHKKRTSNDFEVLFTGFRRPSTLPGSFPPSTIDRSGLNRRVRNGNGCVPWAHHHRRCVVSYEGLYPSKPNSKNSFNLYSIERRWSSRTFRYGYLVTTSPQSLASPSAAPSLRLGHRLRVLPTPMVWRAVCTRPGNVFTATCWFAITSDSSFM